MVEVLYGFRFDCYEGSFLTLENPSDDCPPQICFLSAFPVRPYRLDGCFALDFITPDDGTKKFSIPILPAQACVNFVAKVESQVEFVASDRVVSRLVREYLPAGDVVEYKKLANRGSLFLVFLRVFKINTPLSSSVLTNGRAVKRKFFSLQFGSEEEPIEVELGGAIVPLHLFECLRKEIVYLLKVEGLFLKEYTNTNDDLDSLEKRISSMALLKGRNGDDSEECNVTEAGTRVNYAELFNKVIRLAPGMAHFVDLVRNIHPRYLEIKRLLRRYKRGDTSVRKRFIEIHYRQALRVAMWAHERWGYDLQDSIQECIIALFDSPDKYNPDSGTPYLTQLNWFLRNAINRYIDIGCGLYKLPEFVRAEVSVVRKLWYDHVKRDSCRCCILRRRCSCLFNIVKERFNQYPEDIISRWINYAIGPCSFTYEMIENMENDYGIGILDDHEFPFEEYDQRHLRSVLLRFLRAVLRTREEQVICMHFGIGIDSPMSFGMIGAQMSLTRARVGQIEIRALEKLRTAKTMLEIMLR